MKKKLFWRIIIKKKKRLSRKILQNFTKICKKNNGLTKG